MGSPQFKADQGQSNLGRRHALEKLHATLPADDCADRHTVNNNGLQAGSTIGFATGKAGATVQTVSAILRDSTGPGGGVVGLKQEGTGTLELTGANTYSG